MAMRDSITVIVFSKDHVPRVMLDVLSNRSPRKMSCSVAGWLIDILKYSLGVVEVCRSNNRSPLCIPSASMHESAGNIRKLQVKD